MRLAGSSWGKSRTSHQQRRKIINDYCLFGVSAYGDCLFIMKSFKEYVSFWEVTEVLISKRVQLCDKRHKKHQLHLLSPKIRLGTTTDSEQMLLSLMPPRKSWVSLSVKTRYRDIDKEHRQRKPASRCNWQAIKWTISRDLARDTEPPYLLRLRDFVNGIQNRLLEDSFALDSPILFPEKKDETSCRPLCKFVNLEDSVIVILANKYLTELFDNLFYDESLAFRSKRVYHGEEGYVTTHHDAITRIKEYREKWEGERLYVGECDLQKFYDTVCHSVVRKCYYELLKKARKKNPGIEFEEINRVFEAYLKCYSFPRNVLCMNKKQAFWDSNHIEINQRHFKWVDKELLSLGVAKSHQALWRMRIGVPQGGALSGLIANMVLNTVDWRVKGRMKSRDLYLRYCDDMILISTSKCRCHRLFRTYYNETKNLKLVPHKPEACLLFGKKEFWNSKSKDAYPWGMGLTNAAEWIGFVGYEIRRDGLMRIRKKSFRKELDKQKKVVFEKTLDRIKGKERVSDNSLLSSLDNKLVSMSVGKIAVWNADFIESEMCWAAGFKELEMNPTLSKQLRELDRHRGMMLNAAARRISSMARKGKKLKRKDLKDLEEDKNPDSRGMVHSYYYQFARGSYYQE